MDKISELSEKMRPSAENISKIQNFLKKNYKVIMAVIVVVCIIVFVTLSSKRKTSSDNDEFPYLVQEPRDAREPLFIESKKVPVVASGEVTLSMWVYLNKVTQTSLNHHIVSLGSPNKDPSLLVSFFPENHEQPNNIKVYVKQSNGEGPSMTDADVQNMCNLTPVPLKKWNHLTVSVWGQNVDVYLNGKLARSCVLSSVPSISEKASHNVYVTASEDTRVKGGFDGYISRLQMSNKSASPEQVYETYLSGPYSGAW